MNRFDVTGKTAVVTGAGRGIGKALALGLAEAGAKVACVARTETDIREVVREIQQMGGTAFAIQADLTEDAAPEKVAASVMEKWGRWDILINNAGMNILIRQS